MVKLVFLVINECGIHWMDVGCNVSYVSQTLAILLAAKTLYDVFVRNMYTLIMKSREQRTTKNHA